MARQRRAPLENKADKSANSSSSNGSNSTKQVKTSNSIMKYWKPFIGCICLSVAVTVGYVGYLETRVNTPFDDKKV